MRSITDENQTYLYLTLWRRKIQVKLSEAMRISREIASKEQKKDSSDPFKYRTTYSLLIRGVCSPEDLGHTVY